MYPGGSIDVKVVLCELSARNKSVLSDVGVNLISAFEGSYGSAAAPFNVCTV